MPAKLIIFYHVIAFSALLSCASHARARASVSACCCMLHAHASLCVSLRALTRERALHSVTSDNVCVSRASSACAHIARRARCCAHSRVTLHRHRAHPTRMLHACMRCSHASVQRALTACDGTQRASHLRTVCHARAHIPQLHAHAHAHLVTQTARAESARCASSVRTALTQCTLRAQPSLICTHSQQQLITTVTARTHL